MARRARKPLSYAEFGQMADMDLSSATVEEPRQAEPATAARGEFKALDAMSFYEAIRLAIGFAEAEDREDVADVLRQLPQWRIGENINRIHEKLSAVGLDFTEIMDEMREATRSGNQQAMAVATAKLGMLTKIIES